jgi:hypothetical protein
MRVNQLKLLITEALRQTSASGVEMSASSSIRYIFEKISRRTHPIGDSGGPRFGWHVVAMSKLFVRLGD